jgi:asparagine synthase (glutamine-hydrolysing)
MCGILGNVGLRAKADQWAAACAIQRPRGPDSEGEWHGCAGTLDVSLGHQRLSIIDLSATGAQPMVHPATGSVLVFNGEIYNYIELRSRLLAEGERFVGHSDTEVLLHALEHWGIERTLPLLNGMWAFAWADVRRGQVFLSRDRCGEKPLYVAASGGRTVFASDLRAILHLAPERRALDRGVLAEFLKLGLLDAGTRTMLEGIEQVPAGAFMMFQAHDPGTIPTAKTFWTCPVEAPSLPLPDLIDRCRELFMDSVRIRLRSDVPVGLLLSGGLDSSCIAAAAHTLGSRNIAMLSLVSDDPKVNEGPHIDAMARHLDANVHRVRLPDDPHMLLSHLGDLVDCMGAPVTSLSNVAHWMLMREARDSGMKVVLSGQGGDEILCGYRKYMAFHVQRLLRSGHPLAAVATMWSFLRNRTVLRQFNTREASRYLPTPFRPRVYGGLGALLRDEPVRSVGLLPHETVQERQRRDISELSVPTLTHFEDRSSMSHSNEIRLPFLDHRLIELLVPAPTDQKLHRGWTKYPLRAAMERDLPASIAWRRDKQGFANPEAQWMRTTLRQQFEERFLRADAEVFVRGILDFEGVSRSWRDFCTKPNRAVWVRDFVQLMSLEIWLSLNKRHLKD